MTINEFAQKVEKTFISKKLYYDVWYDTNKMCIEIRHGDWKHDHLYAKHLIKELALKHKISYQLDFTEDVTDDSLDDTYSAIHTIRFIKGATP